jgi:hypothetical protein
MAGHCHHFYVSRCELTQSNAREAKLEVTFSETTTKEVNLLKESRESGGASVENVELQATEDDEPSNEEIKVEGSQTASNVVVTASVEIKSLETQVLPEENNFNEGGAK